MSDKKTQRKQRRGTSPNTEPLPLCMRPNGKGKTGYPSRAKANQARVNQQGKADVRLYTYKCPKCGLFHITSRPQGALVELTDGAVVAIDKPADQVEQDIQTARAGDYTHIRWQVSGNTRPILLRKIRGVIRDKAA